MITLVNYKSDESIKKYNFIFEKAWQDLKDPKNEEKGLGLLANDKSKTEQTRFTDLGHYFSYLQKLIQIDPIYIMLPADEQPFVINANTRTINVPSDFEKCSGVQFDNYAEIITFTINRYFDYQDLANARIAVQWLTPDKKEGVSFIDLIDLETLKHEHKIRFGWPLASEMTASAGKLTFAVRFYTSREDEDGNTVYDYVFNTSPATIQIKPTLAVDFTNAQFKKANDYAIFKDFVQSSSNPSYGMATPVQFVKGLPASDRLNQGSDSLTLYAQASTKDGNPLLYNWYYIPSTILIEGYFYNNEFYADKTKTVKIDGANYTLYRDLETSKTYIWDKDKFIEGTKPKEIKIPISDNDAYEVKYDFVEYKPTQWPLTRPNIDFWINTAEESADPSYALYTLDQAWPVQVAEGQTVPDEVLTTDEIKLYVKQAQLYFKPGNNVITGTYYVKASNVKDDSPNPPTWAESGPCAIKAPEEIVVKKGFKFPNHKYVSEKNLALSIELENDAEKPMRIYELYDLDHPNTDGIGGPVIPNDTSEPTVAGINKGQFVIENCGRYIIKAVSTLNRTEKTYTTTECFISDYAAVPKAEELTITPITVKNPDNNIVSKETAANNITRNADAMDQYTLSVNIIDTENATYTIETTNPDGTPGSKEYTISDYTLGTVSYDWYVQLVDQTGFVRVKDAPVEVVDKNANVDTNSLDINILASGDVNGGKTVYAYKCVVTNTLIAGKEAASSEFFFYFT